MLVLETGNFGTDRTRLPRIPLQETDAAMFRIKLDSHCSSGRRQTTIENLIASYHPPLDHFKNYLFPSPVLPRDSSRMANIA